MRGKRASKEELSSQVSQVSVSTVIALGLALLINGPLFEGETRKSGTYLMPSPKCTLASQYIVHLRYTPLPRARIGNALIYDWFRTRLFLRWTLSWTDKMQMPHILSTAEFKDAATVLSSAERYSKLKLTNSSGPPPSLGTLMP